MINEYLKSLELIPKIKNEDGITFETIGFYDFEQDRFIMDYDIIMYDDQTPVYISVLNIVSSFKETYNVHLNQNNFTDEQILASVREVFPVVNKDAKIVWDLNQ